MIIYDKKLIFISNISQNETERYKDILMDSVVKLTLEVSNLVSK